MTNAERDKRLAEIRQWCEHTAGAGINSWLVAPFPDLAFLLAELDAARAMLADLRRASRTPTAAAG